MKKWWILEWKSDENRPEWKFLVLIKFWNRFLRYLPDFDSKVDFWKFSGKKMTIFDNFDEKKSAKKPSLKKKCTWKPSLKKSRKKRQKSRSKFSEKRCFLAEKWEKKHCFYVLKGFFLTTFFSRKFPKQKQSRRKKRWFLEAKNPKTWYSLQKKKDYAHFQKTPFPKEFSRNTIFQKISKFVASMESGPKRLCKNRFRVLFFSFLSNLPVFWLLKN